MKVMILGMDGYLGWSLTQYLLQRGHEVVGVDNFLRRRMVDEMNATSVIPIYTMPERCSKAQEVYGSRPVFNSCDLLKYADVYDVIKFYKPDGIVHFAEIPSAPYSMIDAAHATFVHRNNLEGTLNVLFALRDCCKHAHLVKLGTMGEYGTPGVDIPEGFFTITHRGREETLPFPRQPGSWYHQTKVHDSSNILMACKQWGLRSTDIMQGVVFGTHIDNTMKGDPVLATRFDVDQCFGTAINRFCAQALLGIPITPFGKGNQKRGFLPLKDSMQCLTIALENPPAEGEYRVFNQFEKVYNVTDLGVMVTEEAQALGFKDAKVIRTENPRLEMEEHYYNPDHEHLLNLGYIPTEDIRGEIREMLLHLSNYQDRLLQAKEAILPDIHWSGEKRKVKYLE